MRGRIRKIPNGQCKSWLGAQEKNNCHLRLHLNAAKTAFPRDEESIRCGLSFVSFRTGEGRPLVSCCGRKSTPPPPLPRERPLCFSVRRGNLVSCQRRGGGGGGGMDGGGWSPSILYSIPHFAAKIYSTYSESTLSGFCLDSRNMQKLFIVQLSVSRTFLSAILL